MGQQKEMTDLIAKIDAPGLRKKLPEICTGDRVRVHQKVREGKKERIEARVLVPGDLIIIEEGDRIPADARLTQSLILQIDELTLTG